MSDKPKGIIAPYDEDAEIAVLGSCLIDANSWYEVSNIVKAEDFYRPKNRWVFESMARLRENKRPIDQITVAQDMANQIDEDDKISLLEAAGGTAYLSHLVYQVPTSVHARAYAKIVAKLSWHRRMINLCNTIADIAYNSGNKTSEIWLLAQQMMYKLIEHLEEKQPPQRASTTEAKPIIPQTKEQAKKVFRGSVPIGEADVKPTA